jgi:hypothetical protein
MNQKIFKLFSMLTTITAIVLSTGSAFANAASTNVITHNKLLINTDPSQGVKSFKAWGIFPSKEKEVRRIVMNLTLAYPQDRKIAHWDYLDHINILRAGGVKGDTLDLEIGHMLTPYGSNFKEGWSFTWKVDVTDFQAFLRDSVEIEYLHSGYESPDLGWDVTLDFKIDFGPVVAPYISMQTLWDGSFQYGNPENDIEESLAPIDITKNEAASFGRFRIQHTGHGMDRPNGCSEFCSRWRELVFDGEIVDQRDIWKECGDNPLYPQGGTWIFDRGYWCPGDLQIPDVIDLSLTKTMHSIDLNMEPFTANDVKQPREVITSYFFQYGEPTHKYDVTIEEISAPNKMDNYNRSNPIGFNPRIRIRNQGSKNLKKLTVTYQTKGFKKQKYSWKGDLAFNGETEITLPGEVFAKDGLNIFSVVLSKPNGKKDQWPGDNKMSSEFYDIPTLPSKLVVEFLTNNKPEDNSLIIVNSTSDTVYNKTPDMLKPATQYTDTLDLAEGNYSLALADTAGDGLEFWFMSESGYGRLRLKDVNGNIIHLFESDCGNGQFYSFRCDDDAQVDTTKEYLSVNIFPRMVTDYLTVYTTTNNASMLKIVITKDGEFVERHEYTNIKDSTTGMDVRHLSEGRYVMEISLNGEHKMNRRFNKRKAKK